MKQKDLFLALLTSVIGVFLAVSIGINPAFAAKPVKPTPKPTASPTPRPTVTPTPSPTPGPAGQITKKVIVLNYDPLINGTTPLHTYEGWNDPATLQSQYISDVKSASHQYVNYQVVNTQTIRDYPVKKSGYKFTQSSYLGCLTDSSPTYCREGLDYYSIINTYNLCGQLNSGTIDEVWIFGAPWFGYEEAAVAGPDITWFGVYTAPITGTSCSKLLPIMGFSYERTVEEMLHNLGHRTETTIRHIYGGWAINLLTAWNRFSMPNKDIAGKASCGNVHFPPNGTSDYDYANKTYVASRCEDWLNYPSTTGKTTQINCDSWNCGANGNNYEKWWLTHLPFATGTTNNKLNNWWAYVVDYDNSLTRSANEMDRTFSIESGANDYNTSCSTVTGANEVYLGVNSSCSPATNYTAKFVYPSADIAKNQVVSTANLEFVVDGPYTNALTENITLSDGTTTTTPISWPITAPWSSGTIVKSVNITSAVQQLVNSTSWTSGKTVTVTISHVSGTGTRRVFAFERESLAGPRIYVKLSSSTPIPTPTPTAVPTPTPSPTPVPGVVDQKIAAAADDYDVSSCGNSVYPNEVYFGQDTSCLPVGTYVGTFVFKNINIAKGSAITNSYVEFTEDGPYTIGMTESITVTDGTTTSTAISWPITTTWSLGTKVQTPSLNALIQSVINSTSWTAGKSLTIKIAHTSGSTTRRVLAFERDPASAARLVINK